MMKNYKWEILWKKQLFISRNVFFSIERLLPDMVLERDEGVLLVHGQELIVVRKGGSVQQHLLGLYKISDSNHQNEWRIIYLPI